MSGQPTLRRKLGRDIKRTWTLFAALVVAVALGLGMYAAMNNSYLNLQESYDYAFSEEGFPDLFVTIPEAQAYADDVRTTSGVEHVRTRVQADLPMTARKDGESYAMVGRVIGYPQNGAPDVASVTPLSGATNPRPGHALVEEHFADEFGLKAGDTVKLTTATGEVDVPIDGVVASAEYFWPAPSRQVVFTPPASFGVLFVTEDDAATWSATEPNQALVLLTAAERSSDNAPATLDSLRQKALSDGASDVYDRAEQPSNSILQEDIDSLHQMAIYFPLLFLFAAGLAIYVLLSRRVAEERQIIGTLRATGVKARPLGWHYLSYALLAGVIGTAIGVPLGTALAGALTDYYAELISLPASLTVRGGLRIPTVVIALVLALSATALAAWWPARRAMRIMPAEAMRGEVPATTHSRSWMERIVPGSRHFSAKWRLILRNIGRSGARSAFTAIGVALSIMLVLSTIGLYTSMSNLIDVEFGSVIRNDGQVEFATAVTQDQVQQVKNVKDVQDVETAISEPVSVADGSDVYATTLTGVDRNTTMHGFITKKGDPVELPASGFLVDQSVTAQLPDLAVGDEITVTLTGPGVDDTKIKGKVQAFAFEPLGAYLYADKSWLADQASDVQASDVLLTTTAGADQDTVRKDVSNIPGALVYVDTASLLDTVVQYEALFNAIAIVMMILGAIMAFAIIFTTMSVSIFERYREIATFRAAGVKFSTIASTVRWENIIVSVFGVIPGVLLGVIGAAALGRSLSSDEYTIVLSLPWIAVVLVVLGVLLVALLSQVPGMLRVRHMSVADVVRERAQ